MNHCFSISNPDSNAQYSRVKDVLFHEYAKDVGKGIGLKSADIAIFKLEKYSVRTAVED